MRDFVQFKILSILNFVRFGILSHSGFSPIWILSDSGFFPLWTSSNSGFSSFGILSNSASQQNLETQGYQWYGVKRIESISRIRLIVKQGLERLFFTLSNFHFFSKTDVEQYLVNAIIEFYAPSKIHSRKNNSACRFSIQTIKIQQD